MPEFKNKPNSSIKTSDGEIWISRSVAVVVTTLLRKDSELYALLIRRGNSVHAPDKWCMPCGYLDWNETATECAMREMWEEAGLDVSTIAWFKVEYNGLNTTWDINTNPTLNDNQDIALHYSFVISSDEFPILSSVNAEEDEVVDLKWVKLSEFSEYNFAFGHDDRIRKFLNYYHEKVTAK